MTTHQVFGAICPTFGPRFAFHAPDQATADKMIIAWNRYHGFQRDADARHSAKPIGEVDPNEAGVDELPIHDDYFKGLQY
jgi:hypothetical protein